MNPSNNLDFNYLSEGQIQKHITVNNALSKLDACAQWVVGESTQAGADGTISVSENGVDLLVWLNGGAEVLAPKMGWRAYFLERNSEMIFDGANWQPRRQGLIEKQRYEIDFSAPVVPKIEPFTILFAVGARVTADLTGTGVTGWNIGVAEDPDRYGASARLEKDAVSWRSANLSVYGKEREILIAGEGGEIETGELLIDIYALACPIPNI